MTEIVSTFNISKLEQFLLIMTRITSFIFISPVFGMSNVPARVKAGLGVMISFLLYGVLEYQIPEYTSLIDYAGLVVLECVAGLLLGFGAYICTTIILFTGSVIDMEIGLSMATQFDPLTKTQASIMGSLYQYMILILMILSDMHLYLLKTLADSYQLIPIGKLMFGSSMYSTVVGFLTQYIILGFRIALPVFAAMLLMNIIMGVLAKAAPQISMFAVGIQIKLFVGLAVIYLTIRLLPDIADIIFDEIRLLLTELLRGMM